MQWIEQIEAKAEKEINELPFDKKIVQGFSDKIKASLQKNNSLKKFVFGTVLTSKEHPSINEDSFECELSLNGIAGNIYLHVPAEFIKKICVRHINDEVASDSDFLIAFVKFLVLEAIYASCSIEPLKQSTPIIKKIYKISESSYEKREISLCLSIPCIFDDLSIPLNVIFSKQFSKSWSKYWGKSKFAEQMKENLLSSEKVLVTVEAANAIITADEFKSITAGDWIRLSSNGFDIESGSANVNLVLSGDTICSGVFDGTKVSINRVL